MSEKSRNYRERGIKAAMTRAQKRMQEEQSRKIDEMSRRGRKAGVTITESELDYIDVLLKNREFSRNQIFHHLGLPDLMAITNEGKVKFYEIKPEKGGEKRTKLNPNQVYAIKEALKNERVQEIDLVRYAKLRKGKQTKYVYASPIRLTVSNIGKYSL